MISLIMAISLVQAAPATAKDSYQACLARTDTNYGWQECGAAYLQRVDRKLNLEWARTYALAEGRTKADLLKEQRAWIAYKDASCRFYIDGDWGREGQVLHYYECRGGVIEQRTNYLAAFREFMTQ